jgi:hypothetical protein
MPLCGATEKQPYEYVLHGKRLSKKCFQVNISSNARADEADAIDIAK